VDNLNRLEHDLWEAADQLRANSRLTASEYSMPVLGLIFLRHATNRYMKVKAEIEPTLPTRDGERAPLTPDHYKGKAAIYLPKEAQYDYLVGLPEDQDIGQAIVDAMKLIEGQVEMLQGALPKEYTKFDPDLLRDLVRIFNRDALRQASGDVFGRIYEYFLNKFAMTGAQEGGEFFTPPSIVRTIVNVIEPDHGIVFDPACGSAGMFVWTGYFLNVKGTEPTQAVTFYGQEKAEQNTRLARMNMAIHGLEGKIVEGNTYYEDHHDLVGKCSFLMAIPPFNVDGVDPKKIEKDPRLPFKIPGISSKTKTVSNANYLWIQYFYSYLNETGRGGFVMASSASDAGHGEKRIREDLIKTGHVDVMIAIGTNFFYTKTLPCTLWFFDKNKPQERQDQVLMLDARNIYRVVTRKIRDFSDEQLKNLTAIVWLYRGQTGRYLELVRNYLDTCHLHAGQIKTQLEALDTPLIALETALVNFTEIIQPDKEITAEAIQSLKDTLSEKDEAFTLFKADRDALLADLIKHLSWYESAEKTTNVGQLAIRERLDTFDIRLKDAQRYINELAKITSRALEITEKELSARKHDEWDNVETRNRANEIEIARVTAIESLRKTLYFYQQTMWLQTRFPDGW
jgi:type I restriction enzyme M protein